VTGSGPADVKTLAPAGTRRVDVGTQRRTTLDEYETAGLVRAHHTRDVPIAQRRSSIALDQGGEERQPSTRTRKAADGGEDALVLRQSASQQRSPWEVDRDLVSEGLLLERLDWITQQDEVRQLFSRDSARRVRKRIRGGVESDREGVRSRARYVERVAPVTRAGVDHRARERAGALGDLTDVDVDESLADELMQWRQC
jgi:hypothetical protein